MSKLRCHISISLLWGGAQVAQQYLAAGLLDELEYEHLPARAVAPVFGQRENRVVVPRRHHGLKRVANLPPELLILRIPELVNERRDRASSGCLRLEVSDDARL